MLDQCPVGMEEMSAVIRRTPIVYAGKVRQMVQKNNVSYHQVHITLIKWDTAESGPVG